jgi:predicted MFS family arabinose efflux permease
MRIVATALAAILLAGSLSVALLLLIRTSFQVERERAAEASLRREVATGLRFLWIEPRLRAVAALQSSFMAIIYPAGLAVIVLARDRLHADARTIGLTFSLGGFGGLLGAVATGWIRAHLHVGQVLMVVFALGALAASALAMAASVGIMIGGWIAFSVALPVYFATMYAYRVTLIPDELQGRVNSIFRLLTQGGAALGAAVGGFLLGQLGVRPTFWLISLGLWLCALAVSSTELRRL